MWPAHISRVGSEKVVIATHCIMGIVEVHWYFLIRHAALCYNPKKSACGKRGRVDRQAADISHAGRLPVLDNRDSVY